MRSTSKIRLAMCSRAQCPARTNEAFRPTWIGVDLASGSDWSHVYVQLGSLADDIAAIRRAVCISAVDGLRLETKA